MRRRIFPAVATLAIAACWIACASPGPASAPPVTLAEAPPRFATLDSFRVRYKSLGAGREALVFIHG
jgi:hypothetical protein